MFDDRLTNELHHGLSRVKRGERILEYHLHLLTQRAHLFAAVIGDILSVENDLSSGRLKQF